MVNTEAEVEKLLHLLVPRLPDISPEEVELRVVLAAEFLQCPIVLGGFPDRFRCLYSLLPRVDENHDLVALTNELRHLLEHDVVCVLPRRCAIGLTLNTDEVLFQRDWTEG